MREHGLNLRYFGVWLGLCAIWSSTWIVIKLGLQDLPPIGFCGLRFVIASLALLGFNVSRGAVWPRTARDWGFIAFTGFLTFGVNYGLLFWAEQFITSGLCAVLQATIPAFGLIFAHFMLSGERLTPLKVGGVSVGLIGVAVIFSGELHLVGRQALWGCAAVIVGAASTSFVNVLIKQRGQGFDPAVLANGQMVFGFLPLLALGWTVEGMPWHYHWTGQAVFDLFYLALLGSSLAFCLLYWLVRRVEVTRIMLISLVTPVAAVLIGAAALNEKLVGGSLLGGVLVMLGMGLVVYRRANVRREEGQAAAGPIPAVQANGDAT